MVFFFVHDHFDQYLSAFRAFSCVSLDLITLVRGLETQLTAAKNEREVQPFLKANLMIVRNAFNVWAWNHAEALPEFRLGADGQVDFLVLSAHSGNWNAIFVELKSPKVSLFTKNGLPSKSLNEALSQLDERERWVKCHEPLFRKALSRHLKAVDAPAYCSHADSHQTGETEILDPRTMIQYEYVAVIGRRFTLTTEDQTRRASIRGGKAAVATYDRLIDVAARLDQSASEVGNGFV